MAQLPRDQPVPGVDRVGVLGVEDHPLLRHLLDQQRLQVAAGRVEPSQVFVRGLQLAKGTSDQARLYARRLHEEQVRVELGMDGKPEFYPRADPGLARVPLQLVAEYSFFVQTKPQEVRLLDGQLDVPYVDPDLERVVVGQG